VHVLPESCGAIAVRRLRREEPAPCHREDQAREGDAVTNRAKRKPDLVKSASRHHLSDVPFGHFAVLADGRTARVAALVNGRRFVRWYRDGRCIDAPLTGPFEIDAATPVVDIIAPELVAADRSAVKDPVAA
jgi:hypothetical protein